MVYRPFVSSVALALICDSLCGEKDNRVCDKCGLAWNDYNPLLRNVCYEGRSSYFTHRCTLHKEALGEMRVERVLLNLRVQVADKTRLSGHVCPVIDPDGLWRYDI